jgi:uncharacterized protein YcfJ
MNKFVVFAIAISASAAVTAQSHMGTVTGVDPVYREVIKYRTINVEDQVCYQREMDRGDGWIERGSNTIFGSTGGLIGTVAGVAVGSQIGGGSGRDAAMVVGGLLGNHVGNDVARRNNTTSCEVRVRTVNEPYTDMEIHNYRVNVDLDGARYTVIRSTQPTIGSRIPVNLTVN